MLLHSILLSEHLIYMQRIHLGSADAKAELFSIWITLILHVHFKINRSRHRIQWLSIKSCVFCLRCWALVSHGIGEVKRAILILLHLTHHHSRSIPSLTTPFIRWTPVTRLFEVLGGPWNHHFLFDAQVKEPIRNWEAESRILIRGKCSLNPNRIWLIILYFIDFDLGSFEPRIFSKWKPLACLWIIKCESLV